jgi:hypothetical protein
MWKRVLLLGSVILSVAVLRAQDTAVPAPPPGWLVFPVSPYLSSEKSLASVGFLNEGKADSRISIKGAHYVNEEGERVRFFGSNVCFASAFPSKEVAPMVAERMRQLGFNMLRFHHMDNRHIWNKEQTALDPEQLDRLHWFLFQLKERGIYANINLHVSRNYPGMRDYKFPAKPRTFVYGKVLDKFFEPYIALQEEYASMLLESVNPYTKLRLADDPMVAVVEINNENTLMNMSIAGLDIIRDKDLGQALQAQWGQWLAKKYPNLDAVLAQWNSGCDGVGAEMLSNGGFADGETGWSFEGRKEGACEVAVDVAKGVCRLDMTQLGAVAWAYQVHYPGLPLRPLQAYTVRFRARSESERRLNVCLRMAHAPWDVYTAQIPVQLSAEWQDYEVVLGTGGLPPDAQHRLSFNLGDAIGSVEFAQISLREGADPKDFGKPSSFADLQLPERASPDLLWKDFRRFLYETECAYVQRMRRYLREKIGVTAPIVDTQASYGGLYGFLRESRLSDYIDMHSYWQHPVFPNRPWDGNDWYIGNTPMSASSRGGTLSGLARWRHPDMPYSLSEYDHATPNEHQSEMFPMLGSFAAYQDWDALYQFCWEIQDSPETLPRLKGYFDMAYNPAKSLLSPFAALVFRRGWVAPAAEQVLLEIPEELLESRLPYGFPGPSSALDGYPGNALFTARLGTRVVPGDGPVRVNKSSEAITAGTPWETPQISWTNPSEGSGRYAVNAPQIRMITGQFAADSEQQLGDVRFRFQSTEQDTVTAALAALDEQPLAQSRRMLLCVVSKIGNSGMEWDEARRTVAGHWGKAPTIAAGVPFTLLLPGEAKPTVRALNPAGEPIAEIPVTGQAGRWEIRTDPAQSSLWFAISR